MNFKIIFSTLIILIAISFPIKAERQIVFYIDLNDMDETESQARYDIESEFYINIFKLSNWLNENKIKYSIVTSRIFYIKINNKVIKFNEDIISPENGEGFILVKDDGEYRILSCGTDYDMQQDISEYFGIKLQ